MATDYFLKIDTIDGESLDSKYAAAIQIDSWSWGASNSASFGAGGGGGSGKVNMQDFHFTMPTSKASPGLMLACSQGKHIATATMHARKAGTQQNEYLTFKFTDVLISSYQVGGSQHGGELPIDQVALAFAKIEWTYQPQDSKGAVGNPLKGGWDLQKNVKI